ncbi:MAG: hypothetical protein EXS48_03250 [Candidatus Staskawiczbacteria bacterium]|nr:hypothetical protein [Candidatus Staskawiczbacteria bacterium]
MFQLNKNSVLVGVAILAIVVTGCLLLINANPNIASSFAKLGASDDAVAQNAIKYISENLLKPEQVASLESFSMESGLIKLKVNVDGKSYNSYATRDGKFLFPLDPIEMNPIPSDQNAKAEVQQEARSETPPALAKVEKSMLEAYIVSRCPFGLQIQRAMADAIKTIPALAEHLKVMYMGAIVNGKITAMHGDAEAQENLRQICIRDEQRSKYWAYVSCQLEKGDTTGCQTSAGINATKLNGCVSDASRGLSYAKEDFDSTAKYGVEGSPTVILNGKKVSEFDFGGRSSEAMKSLICNSSTTAQEFCSTKLNTEQAATSFSLVYAGAQATVPAGSNTSCAPAN